VGFDVLTTCQASTVWCSRERLPAAAAQPAQGSSEPVGPRIYFLSQGVKQRGMKLTSMSLYVFHAMVLNKYQGHFYFSLFENN
jgi:hypothetical protein